MSERRELQEFSPKGIRIPAQGKRVFERRPGLRLMGIVCALQGHGNAMIAIQIKKSCGNCVLTVPLPLQGKSMFLTGDPGRRSKTSLPWAGIRSPFRGKISPSVALRRFHEEYEESCPLPSPQRVGGI